MDLNESEEQVAARLTELQNLLQEAETLRRKQFLVSACTVLLMLVILTCFIFGMTAYFRTYPKRQLMQEVVEQNRLILGNPYQFGANRQYDRKLIRHFLGQLQLEIRRRKPLLRKELSIAIRSLNAFAANELRADFRKLLYTYLTAQTREYLKEKKLTPDLRQINQLKSMNLELASAVTDAVFGSRETAAREAFELFQTESLRLRLSEMYRELKKEPLDMVEQRMLENLLECIVCRLNEAKAFKNTEAGL